jgi:hypothetical protein
VAEGYTPDDIVKCTACPINVNTIEFDFLLKNFQFLFFFRFLTLSDQCNKYKSIENEYLFLLNDVCVKQIV